MKRLWIVFGIICLGSFAVLLWVGTEIFRGDFPLQFEFEIVKQFI